MALSACRRKRSEAPARRAFAFVANYDGNAVAAVDLSVFAVARHIALEDHPTEIAAPLKLRSVFALTPESGVLHQIDLESLKRKAQLALGATSVQTMRLSPDGTALYVLAGRKLIIVDLTRFAIAGHIAMPETGATFEVAPYLGTIAVSGGKSGRISLIDPAARKVIGQCSIPGSELGSVGFLSNGKSIVAADLSGSALSVFETASLKRIVELPVAVRPDRLCFSQDGGQLFVTGEGSNALAIVFPYYTPQVAETVLAGRNPGAMAASDDPAYLFVANRASSDVSILNMRSRKVIATVGVGEEPAFITVTPDGLHALVLNRKSGDMAVLRVGGITRNRQKMASLFTMIPVGSTPVSAAVRMV